MRHGIFLAVLSTLALVSLAQEKRGLYPEGELRESRPEAEPNCIPIITDSKKEYDCSGLIVTTGDYHAAINCKDQLLNCSNLPHLQFDDDNEPLQRLSIERCAVPASLECVLSSLDATGGIRTLQFTSISTPITAETVRGLDMMRTLIIRSETESNVYTTVPMEVIKQLPNLHMLRMTQEGLTTLIPFAFNHTGVSAPLEFIEISLNNITELPADTFYGLRKLTTLSLFKNNIEKINVNAFNGLESLQKLDLDGNRISDLPVGLFRGAPLLQKLIIPRNRRPLRLEAGVISGLDHLDELVLSNAEELRLDPKSLSNLPSLQNLSMPGSGIRELPADLLLNSTAVVKLILNNNKLKYLPDTVFSGLAKLQFLDLSNNQLEAVSRANFVSLRELKEIRLDGNILNYLPEKVFSSLPALLTVSISHNRISEVHKNAFRGATALTLDLSHNKLPWACNDPQVMIVQPGKPYEIGNPLQSPLYTMQYLERLNLSHNHITSICDDWLHNMQSLKILDLSYNNLTKLKDAEVNFTSRNIKVNLRNNHITCIIPPTYMIKIPALQLGGNPFDCDCDLYNMLKLLKNLPFDVEDAYCKLPRSLEGVSLTSIAYGKLTSSVSLANVTCTLLNSPTDCQCLVRPEMNRTECDCLDIKNKKLPDPRISSSTVNKMLLTLRSVENLEEVPSFVNELNLSDLKLDSIPFIPENVTHVDLRRNYLSRVPFEILRRNISLELGGNPLECSCWSTEDVEAIKEINDYDSLICANGKPLNELELAQQCSTLIATKIGILLAIALVIVIIAFALSYKYSLEIKVFLFNRGWTFLVKEENIDANKKYDIFLSFVHQDEEFVLKHLLPELDKDYKVCVHTRDWIVGDSIVEQIYRSVADSRRTLIVLSNEFLKSNSWAIEEFRAAQTQTDMDKIPRAVIILYGDVNCDEAPDTIKSHLQINTYIKWGDGMFWERLRYALPKNKIKAENVRRRERTAKAVKKLAKGAIDVVVNDHGQLVNASSHENNYKQENNRIKNNQIIQIDQCNEPAARSARREATRSGSHSP